MEHYELPLVFFTVLSQASVGITLLLTWQTLTGKIEGPRMRWLGTGILLGIASIAAILHLAHPLHAANALLNLHQAWLSREILAGMVYGAAIGFAFLTNGHRLAAVLASVPGVVLVAAQGMTYAAPAMVAIANGLTPLFFFLTVWIMGAAAMPLFSNQLSVRPLLQQGLLMMLLLMLAAPFAWTSGGTIMQLTASQWLHSGYYLVSLLCLVISLVLTLLSPRQQTWQLVFALAGLLLSRMVFFGDTVSSTVNLGQLY